MRPTLSCLAVFLLTTAGLRAGSVSTRILWIEDKPHAEVTLDGDLPGFKEIDVPAELVDAQGARLWAGPIKVKLDGPKPHTARLAIPNIKEPKKQHKLTLSLQHESLGGDYREEITFGQENSAIQTHGLRIAGVFPNRKVFLTLGLNGIRGQDQRQIPVGLRVRDGHENTILNKQAGLAPALEPRVHLIDVTLDTTTAVGPFSLEATIDSEAHQVFFNATLRYAQPNALVPVSGFEHGDPALWFTSSPQNRPNYYITGQMYYSPHLTDLQKHRNTLVSYDREVKHSGRQSLRIDYPVTGESDVWGVQVLPGKPVALALWIEGNESNDVLVAHFEDNSNFTLPAWQRFANFSSATVCKLDFAGWKRFRVPVLGEGLQVASVKGSTEKIDAPIRLMCFTLQPGPSTKPPGKDARRIVRIDDLAVETQAPPDDLLTLEVQNDDAEGRLLVGGQLGISVGNGSRAALKRGRITIAALRPRDTLTPRNPRDPTLKTIWTHTLTLETPAEGFAHTVVPLRELAEKQPHGPVELRVTFVDEAKPGTSVMAFLTLKSAVQACIVHDFEEPITFSGYQSGKVTKSPARVVPGGADGKGHALALEVKPKQDDNSVLFHPALPGQVERVEFMVKGGDRPVTLQPWLIDSGHTGIWLRPYNLFWSEPITVDWKEWRKVTVAAPPVPAFFGDTTQSFLNRPWYPLHFALNFKVADGETPVEVRIDDIRVITHLPDEEQIKAEIDYADETRIHAPGSPLRLIVSNFAPAPAALSLRYQLRSYQGFTAREGKVEVNVPAGAKARVVLLPSLPAGIYDLSVQGAGPEPLTGCVMALDAKRYFGDEPLELLTDPLKLRKQLGLMTEKTYLDWDNFEAAPYLHHYNWFEEELKRLRALPMLPKELLAVSAKNDEAIEAVKKAELALTTARQQVPQAFNVEQAAGMKVLAAEKLIPPAKLEEETIGKQMLVAMTKTAALVKEADQATTLAADAMKALQVAEAALKTTQAAVPVADKALQAALLMVKDAEMNAATAQTAFMTADKEAVTAEAAAKLAAVDPKQKDKVKEVTDKAALLRKKADVLKAAVEVAKNLATAKKADADKAKLALDAAKTTLKTEETKTLTARQAHQQALQKAMTATRNRDQAKQEQTGVEQRLQAARKKIDDLGKMLDMDRKAFADRQKATQDAKAAVEKADESLETARLAAQAAAKSFEEAKLPYTLKPVPIVGFCAEWAGNESIDALQRGTYTRWIPNRLQLPRRLIDWSEFIRASQREYKGRFDSWVFWENPDLEDSPQSIPPRLYRPMFEVFSKWVKLYSPEAKVVAGGFNFPRAVDYLGKIKDVHTLPFDELAVQMNLGELSPEGADLEGFLDELNELLKIRETNRLVVPSELDWSIGKHLSPLQQAAYHARAVLILGSRGVPAHQLSLINTGFEYEGFGVFYRVSYGSSPEVQTFKPHHVPKPSYFALMESRRFLDEWKFVTSVNPPDRSLADNRAFIYRNKAGRLTVALWRAVDGERVYRLPASWKTVKARDVFGFEVSMAQGLRCTPLPTMLEMPEGTQLEALERELRTLEAEDGRHTVVLDLHLGEPASVKQAGYEATGTVKQVVRAGAVLGERKVRETYLDGLEKETFNFELRQAVNVLLVRRWYFDGTGGKLFVKLNGVEQTWDLSKGQGNEAGLRETTFVLIGCKAGKNELVIRHEKPSNGAGWRLETMPKDHLPLERLGMLNGRQTKGELVKHASAAGTPLTLEKKVYETGIGTHATSFIEYPLAGQFKAFEVTVGIDAVTEGRGSVVFRVFVDGKERATSGVVNGFSKPKTLKIDNLDGAQRLILSVTDAGDGNRDDLADWVEGTLWLKGERGQ